MTPKSGYNTRRFISLWDIYGNSKKECGKNADGKDTDGRKAEKARQGKSGHKKRHAAAFNCIQFNYDKFNCVMCVCHVSPCAPVSTPHKLTQIDIYITYLLLVYFYT